jgi:DNA-binding GntR family transcriptional regulator
MPRDRDPESEDGKERAGPESRGEWTYHRIRESIQAGELKPGDRVREIEMAKRLQVSRTPVREALRRLEADGLLSSIPYRGMVIAEPDHQAVMELYEMREVLEGTAAGLAARHASDAEITLIRDLIANDPGDADPLALAHHNRQVHRALYRAAHNRYLLKTLNVLADAMALLGPTTLSVTGRSGTARQEHREILLAIEGRDRDRAEQIARSHIRSAQRARLKVMFDDGRSSDGT